MSSHFQKTLQPWLDCSDKYFSRLYLPAWEKCVDIFLKERSLWLKTAAPQILPFKVQEDLMNFIIAAFKIRSGLMIPFGRPTEEIIREAPKWTYAVYLGALLTRGFQLVDRQMTEKSWEEYVTEEVQAWLKSNEAVSQCLDQLMKAPALSVHTPQMESNILFVILHKVYAALHQSSKLLENGALLWYQEEHNADVNLDHKANATQPMPKRLVVRKESNLTESLINWMGQQLPSEFEKHTINLSEGLFISESWLNNFAKCHRPSVSDDVLMSMMEDCCLEEDGKILHSYRYNKGRKKLQLTGVVLLRQYLPKHWQTRTIQEEFVKSF
jgi:hypothetical protein